MARTTYSCAMRVFSKKLCDYTAEEKRRLVGEVDTEKKFARAYALCAKKPSIHHFHTQIAKILGKHRVGKQSRSNKTEGEGGGPTCSRCGSVHHFCYCYCFNPRENKVPDTKTALAALKKRMDFFVMRVHGQEFPETWDKKVNDTLKGFIRRIVLLEPTFELSLAIKSALKFTSPLPHEDGYDSDYN